MIQAVLPASIPVGGLLNYSIYSPNSVNLQLLNENINRINPPERLALFFTKKEFDSLLKVIDNQYWKDIIDYNVNTGLRLMEILDLCKR